MNGRQISSLDDEVELEMPVMPDHYEGLASAYVRGLLPDLPEKMPVAEVIARGRAAGLDLHRFKRTMGLPRVRAVLGLLLSRITQIDGLEGEAIEGRPLVTRVSPTPRDDA